MTKRELIDEILAARCTAAPEFLARFEDQQLQEYLDHLRQARRPRLSGDARRYDKHFRNYAPSPPAAPAPARRPALAPSWRMPLHVLSPVAKPQLHATPVQGYQQGAVEGTYISQSDPARDPAGPPELAEQSEQAALNKQDQLLADQAELDEQDQLLAGGSEQAVLDEQDQPLTYEPEPVTADQPALAAQAELSPPVEEPVPAGAAVENDSQPPFAQQEEPSDQQNWLF